MKLLTYEARFSRSVAGIVPQAWATHEAGPGVRGLLQARQQWHS
jgi:hypothetical protein